MSNSYKFPPQGQRFTAWGDDKVRVYLIGNPIVYWITLGALALAPLLGVLVAGIRHRGLGLQAWEPRWANQAAAACGWLLLGWLLHYLPFCLMGRVLYFHHYAPALLFACMLSGIVFDFGVSWGEGHGCVWETAQHSKSPLSHPPPHPQLTVIERKTGLGTWFRTSVVVSLSVGLLVSFWYFCGLSYGLKGPFSETAHLAWYDSWRLLRP